MLGIFSFRQEATSKESGGYTGLDIVKSEQPKNETKAT
jgi:hypothetical protein